MMWLFIQQYRKLLALCAIPIIAAAVFFGYRLVHAQSNQGEAFAVNDQMQSLLEEVDGSTPVPSAFEGIETPTPDTGVDPAQSSFVTESGPTTSANGPKTSSKPKFGAAKASSKPRPTVKPTHTSKPKATAKPKATPVPKPAQTPKVTAKPKESAKPLPSQNPNFKINLNKATLAELMTLPQIGESKARAIIAYREQVKEFKTIDELVAVKGIGPKNFEKIKDHLEL